MSYVQRSHSQPTQLKCSNGHKMVYAGRKDTNIYCTICKIPIKLKSSTLTESNIKLMPESTATTTDSIKNKDKHYCPRCEDGGYPEQEIIILTTYGGRDTNVFNIDGSKHYHIFNRAKYEWDHYEDVSEVSKWDRRC